MKSIDNNPYRQLGVYANSPVKERVANHGKLNAFLKVGKEVSFPLDLPQYLPPIHRTHETVKQAEAELTLPQDQLRYAQFWFLKVTPLDEIAFNHLLSGDINGAIDIWKKKDCASSLQNQAVCALIKGDYQSVLTTAHMLYAQYGQAFEAIVIGNENMASTESMAFDFIDNLCDEVGVNAILPYVTDEDWKKHVMGKAIQPLIATIQSAIDLAKSSRGKEPALRYNAGVKLMNDTKSPLRQLQAYLPTSDWQYQNIADKLGVEILQCGIDYYNKSDDEDAAYKAMVLQEYAESIVVGQLAKDRCKEIAHDLKGIISELPPVEVMANHKAIQLALMKFAEQPELIKNSIQLIKDCAPHILAIKEKLGSNNQYYLKISTKIVNSALRNVISEVNEAQNKDFPVLKEVLISAWRTQLYMDKFDLESTYREGRFKECRTALYDIIEKCKGFENSYMSGFYKYGCGWCNNLDLFVSDVDLRTDDEFFASCSELVSYRQYLQKFPKGRHVSKAESKIEELCYKECKTLADYQKFLEDFPNSGYRSKVQTIINQLIRVRDELRKREARQEEAISACVSLDDVFTLYAKEKTEDINIDKCSNKAFELAKTEEELQKIISIFGAKSSGGQKAKAKIDGFERIRKEKSEARIKLVKKALLIGIPILIFVFIYLFWGIEGLANACAIIAFMSFCAAWASMKAFDGCAPFFILLAIAAVFGIIAYGLNELAENVSF